MNAPMNLSFHSSNSSPGAATTGTRPLREQLVPQLLRAIPLAAEEPEAATRAFGDDLRPQAHALLGDALQAAASDLHLDPHPDGLKVRLRIDGVVVDAAHLEPTDGERLVNQFKTLVGLNPAPEFQAPHGQTSIIIDNRQLDLRVTAAPCLGGDKLAVRLLDPHRTSRDLTGLGLEDSALESVLAWLQRLDGLFLVTGPTGAGKTTTLYGLLHRLNQHDAELLTLEDPPEYGIADVNQIAVDAERGLTFSEGVKSILRLDPDYLLLGEIRDAASARAAVDAAASGKALMSTLHSRDAVSAMGVLRNLGLSPEEIAANLSVVVAQRLVRRLCPHCRTQVPPSEDEARWFRASGEAPPDHLWHPVGCAQCHGLGFIGRTGVFEVWALDDQDRTAVRAGADDARLSDLRRERGQAFLCDHGLRLARDGVTALSELLRGGVFLRQPGPPARETAPSRGPLNRLGARLGLMRAP